MLCELHFQPVYSSNGWSVHLSSGITIYHTLPFLFSYFSPGYFGMALSLEYITNAKQHHVLPICASAFNTRQACSSSIGRLYFPVTRYWSDAFLWDGSSRLSQEQVMFLTCIINALAPPHPHRYGECWRRLTDKRLWGVSRQGDTKCRSYNMCLGGGRLISFSNKMSRSGCNKDACEMMESGK